MQQVILYQSILHHLSLLPVDYLKQVEQFVAKLNQQSKGGKKENRKAILALAGTWSDLPDADFDEVRAVGKETTTSLFAREIEL